MKLTLLTIVIAIALLASHTSWASDDGVALYKKKCAGCHGPNGEGKSAMKAPALKGTALQASQLVDRITKGEASSKPPHNKGITSVTEEQAKAIADYVKSLK